MADRPLRITIDARYLRRPTVGISIYLADIIQELAEDREITLVTNDPAHRRQLADTFGTCRVDCLPQLRETLWEQRSLPEYLHHAGPDVYLAGANRGLPIRSPRRTKLVLIVHDLIPLRMFRTHLVPNPFGAARFLFGTAVSFIRADLVITNSHSTAAEVARIRSGVPTVVRYPSVPTVPSADAGPPVDWPDEYLLYCGGSDLRKNVEGLIAAHAEYRRQGGAIPLVIIGFGFDDLAEEHRSNCSDGNVIFTGIVSEPVKWQAVRHARAVLYPSAWEGFGLPILEALAVGTPILAGHGGAQPEVGGDAALYVDVNDRDALTTGIRDVIDPAWRAVVRRRGPPQVERVRAAHRSAGQILDQWASDR